MCIYDGFYNLFGLLPGRSLITKSVLEQLSGKNREQVESQCSCRNQLPFLKRSSVVDHA